MGKAARGGVLGREVPVHDLEMQAAEVAKGEALQARQGLETRDLRREIEPHVRGRPAAERAAEERDAQAAEQDAAEEPDYGPRPG
jgi:hypothetical protein